MNCSSRCRISVGTRSQILCCHYEEGHTHERDENGRDLHRSGPWVWDDDDAAIVKDQEGRVSA